MCKVLNSAVPNTWGSKTIGIYTIYQLLVSQKLITICFVKKEFIKNI